MDQRAIERKWQRIWAEQKAFEPEVKDGKKFMATFPYPYVNGLPHIGHLYSAMRVEAFVRYKRAQGYNALFPQAWHCTGSPIVNAAKRVEEGDPKQIQILIDNGVQEKEIHKFADPVHFINYFVPKWNEDWNRMGLSIDWRREFITTSLNPRYDKFIRWQFRKLKEKDYVAIGKKPVVWCPKENCPVSDHSRLSGEGETPQEFVLILFKLDNGDHVACATLRPETIEGITNIWINPAIDYVRIKIDDMHWIVSKQCADKLSEQEHEVKVLGEVSGKSLVGKQAVSPTGNAVPLLPASFPTADKGTGIVMSVPSDAPDDYVALRDLQQNKRQIEEYKLDIEHIKPIPIIDAGELGHLAAVKVVEDMKIQNQKERDKLEAAKKLVYKKGYYEGVMLGGDYKGEKVEIAKEQIKQAMLATKQAYKFYELTGPVVCRCLTPSVVKIVSNQWFIMYSDPEWKKQVHKAIDNMSFYPEKARQQFDYVIDWLNDWACTREEGLGTRLPWDEHWLIESLSDSTLYNAYYTISHKLKEVPEDKITDELFDYVFQGKGKAKEKCWEELKKEFDYWYPVDFRNSAKELIQNHLSFMVFNHVAILGEDKWPRSYGLNGMIAVNAQKMSKSLGNVILVRAAVEEYSADASRLTLLNGGEGMDDPNWDTELARATTSRLQAAYELWTGMHGKGRSTQQPLDEWFSSKLHSTIQKATDAMELTQFRTALQHSWFDLGNTIRQYLKLTGNDPNKELITEAIETQIRLLQPFTPHICEEAWSAIGKEGLVSHAPWPQADESRIKPELESRQAIIEQLTSDIRAVQQLAKLERIERITVIVSPQWKYDLYRQVRGALEESRDVRDVLKAVAVEKQHTGDAMKLVPLLVKDPSRLAGADLQQPDELRSIEGAVDYLNKTFSTQVEVVAAEKSAEQKAKNASPGKPAIVLR